MSAQISADKATSSIPRWLRVVTASLAVISAAVLLWAAAHPSGNLMAWMLGVMLAIVACGCWLVLLIMAIRRKHLMASLIAAPIVVVIAFGLSTTRAPEQVGFALAKPGMEQAIAEGTCPATLGVLPVLKCQQLGQTGQAFVIEGSGFLHHGGWVKFDDPAEAASYREAEVDGVDYTVTEIGDGWYRLVVWW